MKKSIIAFTFLLLSNITHAQHKVWFHPYDPSLNEIAEILLNAQESIDIAMYNIDVTQRNPIIVAISSREIQQKLVRGDLSIRLIFEGYSSLEDNADKMVQLEKLGVDARYLGASKKVHHKFAVIDGASYFPKVVTGSANWSLSSLTKYSENIVYFANEPVAAANYQQEFNFLWEHSKEFGWRGQHKVREPIIASSKYQVGVEAFFNSGQFSWTQNGPVNHPEQSGYALTHKITTAIDQAENRLEIATTRIKLRPIYDALLRAARRGVKVNIVVTMGQYEAQRKRSTLKTPQCSSNFDRKCSVGTKYSILLDRGEFEGAENLSVRLKYFHLNKAAYLDQQMHNKYMIVDGDKVWTGSFNWSHSSEFNHIENILLIKGEAYPVLLRNFKNDFNRLWEKNRNQYESVYENTVASLSAGTKVDCSLKPMSLKFSEIDRLQNLAVQYKIKYKNICL